MIEVRIPGPLPPSPNQRMHWRALYRKRKVAREVAAEAGRQALGEAPPMTGKVEVEVAFVVPDVRARDFDNAIAAQKPYLDGLVDAGVLPGDSDREIVRLSFGFVHRPGLRAVVYRVRPAGSSSS